MASVTILGSAVATPTKGPEVSFIPTPNPGPYGDTQYCGILITKNPDALDDGRYIYDNGATPSTPYSLAVHKEATVQYPYPEVAKVRLVARLRLEGAGTPVFRVKFEDGTLSVTPWQNVPCDGLTSEWQTVSLLMPEHPGQTGGSPGGPAPWHPDYITGNGVRSLLKWQIQFSRVACSAIWLVAYPDWETRVRNFVRHYFSPFRRRGT